MTRYLALAIFAFSALSAQAQQRPLEDDEENGGRTVTDEARPYDELVANFQRDYLRFTSLIQVVPVVPFEDVEGNQARFDIAAAWFGIGGRLGENVGYFARGDFARGPALLEAYVSYGSEEIRGIVGRQKVPFSAEFLTPAANIDFVNRARAIRALVPGRETGAALNADLGVGSVRVGVFNATYGGIEGINGSVDQQQRGGVAAAGRLQTDFSVGGGTVRLGANAVYNTSDNSDRVDIGDQFIIGADARIRLGAVLIAGEFINEKRGGVQNSREGGYATVGYDLSPDDRVLVRLDTFGSSQEGLIGYNRTLTPAASFQANLVVPFDEQAEPLQALLNFQLSF